MSAILLSILKITIMIVILGAMVIILLGIGQLLSHDDNYSESDVSSMKKDLKNKQEVIGEKSVFNNFLMRNNRYHQRELRKEYRQTGKEYKE